MCSSNSSAAANTLRRQEQEREARITDGGYAIEKAFKGFTPQFYQQAQQSAMQSLLPQLNDQFQAANRNVNYGMANRGLYDSSSASMLGGALRRALANQKAGVVAQAQGVGNDLRQQVSTQKTNLYNQLQASANPELAAQQAVQGASTINAPSSFAPLGNLFDTFANVYQARALNSQPTINRGLIPQNTFVKG